ncbi:sentrin-specific protease 2-like [Nyctibius grandis]|uniref:sentrin-specific protease 2-like n=1 Tax=Nyctibius grandis TaxID=48427 RepID=UPI0035BC61E7
MYQWLLGALGALLAAARRPAPPPAPPPRKRPSHSSESPLKDPDETQSKKKKSDSAAFKGENKVEEVSAGVKLPDEATSQAASVSNVAPTTKPAEKIRYVSYGFSPKRPTKTPADSALEEVDNIPCGTNTCLSTSRNDKYHTKLGGTLTLRPLIKKLEGRLCSTAEEAMEREVDAVFGQGLPSDVLSSAFKLEITRESICTLREFQWLDDEVINFYMNLVKERSKKEGYPTVHVFSTFFYPKLLSGGYNAVKRWTRGMDLFSCDIILVPVHLREHWTLVAIDTREKSVKYYDSLGRNGDWICEIFFRYLQEESCKKRKVALTVSEWTLQSMEPDDIPQQYNASDCGVFMCKYAEYISQDKPLTFNQLHMPFFRRRMVWEIIHQQLL